ncbi:hypothetical protein [Pseudoalteromonas sp. SR43-5]|uniref:hypothetical protein n=1 Tax=Pseudoalteromonas sp. SR43-5 TaxID=2760941 RepID=UPI0015F9CC1D|nr:hypothetical protein [Pseudoalteromonas sp. SR43-5]MBB1307298.1 hypothetical protein [Pseudoalteromonas sp. SR43-5]
MLIFPAKYVLPQQARLRSLDETQTPPSQGGIDHTNRIGYMHKWGIDLTTPKLKYADVMGLFSFVCSLGGQYNPCLFANPYPPIGTGTGLALMRENALQGAQSVALYNLPGAKSGIFEAGDFIKFSNHSKVYMVTQSLNSNGAGQGTVYFTPPLRIGTAQNTALSAGPDVNFTMRLKSDSQDIQLRATEGKEVPVKVEFVEFIND